MYCGKCGAKLSDSARFCGRCGAAIVRKNTSEPIPMQTAAVSTPHKVEEAVPPTPAGPAAEAPRLVNTQPIPPRVENFESRNPPSPSAASAKRMQKPILFAAIAALLICIGAPAIYYVLNKGFEDKPSSAASSMVQSQEPPVEEEPASPPSDPPDPPSMDAAYAEVVSNLQAKYGEGFYDDDGPHGVVIVRKIDFDQDGVDELFCAFYNDSYDPYADDFNISPECDEQNCAYCFEVWGWQNETAVKLTHDSLWGSMSYDITFEHKDDHIYLILDRGSIDESSNWAFTIKDNTWVCAMCLHDYYEFDEYGEILSHEYYMFNTPIDWYEYDRLFNQYFSYEQYQTIPLYYGESQLPETERVIQELQGIS